MGTDQTHQDADSISELIKAKSCEGKQATKRKRKSPSTDPRTQIFLQTCWKMLNAVCVPEYRFSPDRGWRFDYAFPDYKIALEIEGGVWTGGRHINPKGFLNDMEKYNNATLMGWRLLRIVPADLLRMKTIDLLRSAMEGIGGGGFSSERSSPDSK